MNTGRAPNELESTRAGPTPQAFDIAKQAVANQPNIWRASEECDKFCLLPADGAHDVQLLGELCAGSLNDPSARLSAHNLPAFFPLQFVGRQAEWQALVSAAATRQKRLLSLSGDDGLGKTSLALAAAYYLYERHIFPGGVLFACAAGATCAADLSAAVRAALLEADAAGSLGGSRPENAPSAEADVSQLLRHRGPCLLVIDHFVDVTGPAHGGGGGTAFLASLLQKSPELQMLVTSAAPLALAGVSQLQVNLSGLAPAEARPIPRKIAEKVAESGPDAHLACAGGGAFPHARASPALARRARMRRSSAAQGEIRISRDLAVDVISMRDPIPRSDAMA